MTIKAERASMSAIFCAITVVLASVLVLVLCLPSPPYIMLYPLARLTRASQLILVVPLPS